MGIISIKGIRMQSKFIKRKTRRISKGFTLTEMLCTVLLLGLVSAGLVNGVVVGTRQYKRSMRISAAQQLYTSLESLLTNELKYSKNVDIDTSKVSTDGDYAVNSFFSVTYAIEDDPTNLYVLKSDSDENKIASKNEYGQLAIGTGTKFNRMLGKMSYTDGLGAKATIKYHPTTDDKKSGYFVVNLAIGANDDTEAYIDNTFTVRALSINTISLGGTPS